MNLISTALSKLSMITKHCKAQEKIKCDYCSGFNSTDEMLLAASKQGRVECIEHASAAGANVNYDETGGLTPLMLASNRGDDDCVKALIKAGADVNIGNVYDTALILAAEGGHEECLFQLIEAGANVNAKTQRGSTALMHASETGSHESVNILIKAGADVNVTNWFHDSALILAVRSGDNKSVTHLITGGADVNYRSGYLLDIARVDRKVTIMKSLFQAGIPINTRQPYVLQDLNTFTLTDKADKMILRMLHASGDRIGGGKAKLDLQDQCRQAIRDYLLDLDPHSHLFDRVQRLGLPKLLQRYLVYNVNIYDDCEATAADGNNNQVQRNGSMRIECEYTVSPKHFISYVF